MTIERDESLDNHSHIVIDHFHSSVIEAIAFLALEAKQEKPQQVNELSEESRRFFQKWKNESAIDFLSLFNFLMPCPAFHDIKLFVDMMQGLSDEEFIYHLFGEELDKNKVGDVLKDPRTFMMKHETILWDSDEKQNFVISLIENLNDYRSALAQILQEVASTAFFVKALDNRKAFIEDAMQKMKSLPMEPLTLAQYIMGKNFRRVSNYKMYYFIPSYFFPSKIRIFNSSFCIVIYQCASPISDDLQKSKDLDAKLKAIADPNRLILLRLLSGQKLYGARLAEYVGVTTATVSHHLDLLKKAGLIKEEKVGTIKYFTSNKEKIETFIQQLQMFLK